MEEYQSNSAFLSSLLGAWESVNGNPDVYIYQGYEGEHHLLAYSYDRESERGSFSSYDIHRDEKGYYIRMGMKLYYLSEEKRPYGLCIGAWGSYMRN